MAQLNLRTALSFGLTNAQIDNNFTSLQRDTTLAVSNAVPWAPNTAYAVGQILYAHESVYPSGGMESIGFLKTGVSYIISNNGGNGLVDIVITGTAGTFSCFSSTISVGQAVAINGTNTGTGSITGYNSLAQPGDFYTNVYYVIATNGTTTFTLSATPGGPAITTTAGTPSGLTFAKFGGFVTIGAPNNFVGTVFTATGPGSGNQGQVTRVTRFYRVTAAGTTGSASFSPNWLAPTSSTSGTATLLAIDLPPAYLPADVLDKIKLVDGVGSGLDADLLDGQNGSYYLDTSATTQTKAGDLIISGNLTVNGTTTTLNSTNLSIDDVNIELASIAPVDNLFAFITAGSTTVVLTSAGGTTGLVVGQRLVKSPVDYGVATFGAGAYIASIVNATTFTTNIAHAVTGSISFTATHSDVTANGGGITVKGTTDKTFSWLSASTAWTSSEDLNLATGKVFKINNTSVLSATTLGSGVTGSSLTSVGTIGTGTWQGTVVSPTYGGTGVNNGGRTITLAGNLSINGAFSTALTVSAATSLTLPTTGTLATLTGTETFSNKSFNTGVVITTSGFGGAPTSMASLDVTDTGINGANIRLIGNEQAGPGQPGPNKTIRAYLGTMQVMNHAYNAAILQLTDTGELTVSGNVTAFSDARLKSSLNVITDALAKVEQLTGYTYTRTDSGERQTGVLAQDAIKVLPEVVNTSGEYMSVAYGNFAGLIFEAIKELHAKVKDLETKIK
jgi:hypothetical protein